MIWQVSLSASWNLHIKLIKVLLPTITVCTVRPHLPHPTPPPSATTRSAPPAPPPRTRPKSRPPLRPSPPQQKLWKRLASLQPGMKLCHEPRAEATLKRREDRRKREEFCLSLNQAFYFWPADSLVGAAGGGTGSLRLSLIDLGKKVLASLPVCCLTLPGSGECWGGDVSPRPHTGKTDRALGQSSNDTISKFSSMASSMASVCHMEDF